MKALRKEFWMEIRRSKSRFISILLIVALGVAFFSGIQASSPDMRYSGDAYYDESCLMDIKVVGTMGLTEDDVEKGYIEVANRKGVIEQFPLTAISIGVVEVDRGRFANILEIGEVGAQVKHMAKSVIGSSYAIDRRKK